MIEESSLKIPLKKWEFASSPNMIDIFNKAKALGWLENKVQVRRYMDPDKGMLYIIEPYEENCTCPGLIKFRYKEVNNEEL